MWRSCETVNGVVLVRWIQEELDKKKSELDQFEELREKMESDSKKMKNDQSRLKQELARVEQEMQKVCDPFEFFDTDKFISIATKRSMTYSNTLSWTKIKTTKSSNVLIKRIY